MEFCSLFLFYSFKYVTVIFRFVIYNYAHFLVIYRGVIVEGSAAALWHIVTG
jgi:hypothetical protein